MSLKSRLDDLNNQILIAPFVDLEPHLKRGAVILLEQGLDLAQTGLLLAEDNKEAIEVLVKEQMITKASSFDIQEWRQHKQFFKILIVQPFVLAQKYVHLNTPASN